MGIVHYQRATLEDVPRLVDLPGPGDAGGGPRLAAGASDYVTKPVDLDRLLTLMRTWLAGRAVEDGQ